MNIGLDMMGGDFAPLEAAKGILLYLSGQPAANSRLFLFGNEAIISPLVSSQGIPPGNIQIVHAPETIGMHEHPTKALKEKQQSSIAIGFQDLSAGKIDAFISAGNTGAMLVGAMFSIKVIEGILRPTIATLLPKENGQTGILLDVGLNADCKPENLNQFAVLGSLYAKHVLGIPTPRVGLLNVGEEEGKGNLLAQAAHALLKQNTQIHFVGNVEGRDILLDKADVMVCEGFTGNIVLKMAESIYDITRAKQIEHPFLDRFNFEHYGGTPVLGVAKPVIIGHGISQATAFKNMIAVAAKMITANLMAEMKASFTGNPNA